MFCVWLQSVSSVCVPRPCPSGASEGFRMALAASSSRSSENGMGMIGWDVLVVECRTTQGCPISPIPESSGSSGSRPGFEEIQGSTLRV